MEERPRALSPNIEYHNEGFVSDVEVELDLEFTPSPARMGGLKKSKSRTDRITKGYHNQAYSEDDNNEQTNV